MVKIMDFQTAIATLDKTVMDDIVTTQFRAHGVNNTIYTTTVKGVPLYLIQCTNGISYVCTRAQALYFVRHLADHAFTFKQAPKMFRVFPAIVNIQHSAKGAQFGTHYTSLAKAHDFCGCLPL